MIAPLQALRGLAALSVLTLHCWLYTTREGEKHDSFADGLIHQLRLAVPLFFCLSAFMLYRAWVASALDGLPAPRTGEYLRRRARRILPGYWLCLVATVILLEPLADTRGVDVPPSALLGLFAVFAQNLHPATTGALDPPMWTLAVEVQFYLVLPLLAALAYLPARGLRARRRSDLLVAPFAMIAASLAFDVFLIGRPGSIVAADSLLVAAPAFACGMAARVLLHGRALSRAAARWILALGASLVVADGAWHESGAGLAGMALRDLPADAGFALVVAALSTHRGRMFASRPLLWLGSISFGVYLWHMPLMLFERGVGLFPEHQPIAAALAVSALTLPVAWASWALVERPLLRRSAVPRSLTVSEPQPSAVVAGNA